jgi:hypothetical protein
MQGLVEERSGDQEHVLEAVRAAEEAAKAAQGAARAAQASSVAAQHDASRVAQTARVIDIDTGEHEIVPVLQREDTPTSAAAAYEELRAEDAATTTPEDDSDLFWAEPPEHSSDDFIFDDGSDGPLLGKIWSKLRAKDPVD